jgi:2-keto-3-deoxy-L-rhamnonate aldolase RhmA
MRANRLRELLNSGKPTLGTHVQIPWPSVVEFVGMSEMFDYVEFVAEYSPYSLQILEDIGRTVELFDGLTSMIKVEQEPRGYVTWRSMGSGIQNLLYADVRSAEEARQCVRIVRAETPEAGGIHGASMRRSVRFGGDAGSPDFVKSTEEAVIALMVEKAPAMDELDEILAVDGVDMVQFGAADFSMSIGRPGEYSHPEVRAAEKLVIGAALAAGKHPRAEIGSPDGAKHYLDMGVRHFCVGTDVSILINWFRTQGDEMRKVLEGK